MNNKAGVVSSCFDMDVVETADGELLVTHPARLAEAAGVEDAEAHTLAELRERGAGEERFPSLHGFLHAFAEQVRISRFH